MSRSRGHWNVTIFLSRDEQKTFIKSRHANVPVTCGEYFRLVKTAPIKMLRKSFFTLPAESLKKKYGSEASLGHATRYHGDVNLKHTILTGIMQWPRLTLVKHFLLKIHQPLIFQSKKMADPGLIYLSHDIASLHFLTNKFITGHTLISFNKLGPNGAISDSPIVKDLTSATFDGFQSVFSWCSVMVLCSSQIWWKQITGLKH